MPGTCKGLPGSVEKCRESAVDVQGSAGQCRGNAGNCRALQGTAGKGGEEQERAGKCRDVTPRSESRLAQRHVPDPSHGSLNDVTSPIRVTAPSATAAACVARRMCTIMIKQILRYVMLYYIILYYIISLALEKHIDNMM